MKTTRFLSFLFCFVSVFSLAAQKEFFACSDDTRPTLLSSCFDACLLCDVDGFNYRNRNAVGYRHDNCASSTGEYFAFVAMTEFITFSITNTDCQVPSNSSGIPRDKFTSLDWFSASGSACDPSVSENGMIISAIECSTPSIINQDETREFTNISPLTVGGIYYFTLSDAGNTVCFNSIRVIAGSTAIPELTNIELNGPAAVCVGASSTYTTLLTPSPLVRYLYTLDGDTLDYGQQDTLAISWSTPGSYNLCVSASNPCSGPLTECRTVTVSEPTQRDSTIYLCAGDCFPLAVADEVCAPGLYARDRLDAAGCTITTRYNVVAVLPDTTRLSAAICSGDSLSYRQVVYNQPGVYTQTLTGSRGCDSVVLIDLSFVPCALATSLAYASPVCHNTADGNLTFSVLSGAPPFTYSAARLGGTVTFQGVIPALGSPTTLGGLGSGTYLVNVSDDFGSSGVLTAELVAPPPLAVTETTSQYGNFTNRCAASEDGSITLLPAGGTPPYAVNWPSGLPDGTVVSRLLADVYPYILTDSAGCLLAGSVTLTAPPKLFLIANARDESCDTIASGSITLSSATGGTPPYRFDLTSNNTNIPPPYDNLPADTYRLTVTDNNGCLADTLFDIQRPRRPEFLISPASAILDLGETIDFAVMGDNIASLSWSGREGLSCDTCLLTSLRPFNSTTVVARATSDDGCVSIDSVTVTVATDYPNYFPNAFSPNGDGINDIFYPHAGRASERLLWLRVYDRWGGNVFQQLNLALPMSPADGWDGNVGGMAANTGIYLWSAEIQHLDGKTRQLSGVVNLLR